MAVEETDGGGGGDVEWMYRLVDGVCTDSMVFVTVARFGVLDAIVARAKELASYASWWCGPANNGIEEAVPPVVWWCSGVAVCWCGGVVMWWCYCMML